MHPLIETIERLAHQAQNTWEDEAFQQRLDEAKERLAKIVKANPVGSVGIALLAGFLIGKITKSGRKE